MGIGASYINDASPIDIGHRTREGVFAVAFLVVLNPRRQLVADAARVEIQVQVGLVGQNPAFIAVHIALQARCSQVARGVAFVPFGVVAPIITVVIGSWELSNTRGGFAVAQACVQQAAARGQVGKTFGF